MEVQDERADQHEPQHPQDVRAGQDRHEQLAQELAVDVDVVAARRRAMTPRYTFRLPIMWATTKPMPMMPVIAITYFLPTAVE